ncbi:enoyl-CoA hydratase/isomerase family protein [Noviherbaspirillum sp. UKPF54]|uniref:enoyl-CoA hydratase/isomerase family protein n=1 Tax=Noviherbaspirillum sp. UKPF54 TaxID=2601898 RepID=UPI0011B11D1F|nr:enoyl-CoA hydratase/isomerase family protein [Noviherbaspirillum sp. UKPF54]QDZ29532.1 enoyl-CoA hydratase/isomerase family protein [Noviherbaspirillum sp. UKPF54]
MSDDLLVEVRGRVLWLTINRPERRNAINAAVLSGIRQALEEAGRDRQLRAIVLTGAGERAFCSGADLQEPSFRFDYAQPYQWLADLLRTARRSTTPIIARVNGACLAGGMGLLAMCDMAVASRDAVFGLPEVKVGVFPAQVLSVLQHQLPRRVLTEMCITGATIDAQQALACGLVNHVADGELDAKLDWLLDRLLDKSPSAIRRALYTMKQIEALPFEASVAFTESQIGLAALTDDFREGLSAFIEKRQPNWTGQ